MENNGIRGKRHIPFHFELCSCHICEDPAVQQIMPTLSIHQKQMRKRYINFSKILSYQVVGICISVVLMSFEIKERVGVTAFD